MEEADLFKDGKRIDGRNENELRSVEMTANVLNSANGSALIRWGKNKILAGVYGPREFIPRHAANLFKSKVKCFYKMAPFCSEEKRDRPGPNRRSLELSKVISQAFQGIVFTEHFPKTEIDVFIEVLQSDGGTRCAAITAASLALAHAGIPMRDMVVAVAAGKAAETVMLDLCKEEDNFGESDIPMAISVNGKQFLLLQLDGRVKREELSTALDMGLKSVPVLFEKQKKALELVYSGEVEEKQSTEVVL